MEKTAALKYRAALYAACAAVGAVFLLARRDICVPAIGGALLLCVRVLVPSLFPMFCLNAVLCGAGAPETAAASAGRLFSRIFGAPPQICAPYLVGLAAGAPVGAWTVIDLYERGECTKDEAERALALCSNPGPAFVIGGVGAMLGDVRRGALVYAALTVCSAAVCAFSPGRRRCPPSRLPHVPPDTRGLFARAVAGSAAPMLTVCAFVVFFAPVCAAVRAALEAAGAPPAVAVAVTGFFEMTHGTALAAALPSRTAAASLCAAVCGWSGICVAAQISSRCAGLLSTRRYFLSRAVTALLSAALTAAIFAFFDPY